MISINRRIIPKSILSPNRVHDDTGVYVLDIRGSEQGTEPPDWNVKVEGVSDVVRPGPGYTLQ